MIKTDSTLPYVRVDIPSLGATVIFRAKDIDDALSQVPDYFASLGISYKAEDRDVYRRPSEKYWY